MTKTRFAAAGVRAKSDVGAALVEVAMIIPLLVVILLGAMDFGRVFFTALAVTGAARVGAQYGAQSTLKAMDTTVMESKATAAAADISGFTATAVAAGTAGTNPCMCFDPSTNAEAPMATCTSTCTSPSTVRVYAKITGAATFTTIVNYPGIPHTLTISRTVWIRAQ